MCMGRPYMNVPVFVDVHRVEARGGFLLYLSLQSSCQTGSLTDHGEHCYCGEVSGQPDPALFQFLTTQSSGNRSM